MIAAGEFRVTDTAVLMPRQDARPTSGRRTFVKAVRPDVWRRALRIAGGDPTRLVPESRTSVLVLSRTAPGRR
jgi:hypothetical protein